MELKTKLEEVLSHPGKDLGDIEPKDLYSVLNKHYPGFERDVLLPSILEDKQHFFIDKGFAEDYGVQKHSNTDFEPGGIDSEDINRVYSDNQYLEDYLQSNETPFFDSLLDNCYEYVVAAAIIELGGAVSPDGEMIFMDTGNVDLDIDFHGDRSHLIKALSSIDNQMAKLTILLDPEVNRNYHNIVDGISELYQSQSLDHEAA